MEKIERVPTGIPGFDSLVEGGLVRNSTTLLSGGTGTGKTIFCTQFLYNGATKYNEPGVLLSFEEDFESIKRDVSGFGWDLDKLVKEDKLAVLYEEPSDLSRFAKKMEEEVLRIGAKRLVIDSTSVFGMTLQTKHEVRMRLFDLIKLLRKLKVTSIMIAETLEESQGLSRFGVEEFVSDGVVVLKTTVIGEDMSRTGYIQKMRSTNMKGGIRSVQITPKGFIWGVD